MARAIIGLGGNLGEPLTALRFARRQLGAHGNVEAASSLYRTAPVGGPADQPDYLNAVIFYLPSPPYREPAALLGLLLEIERRQGRSRRIRWQARTLDLDLLAYGDMVVAEPGLQVPHPLMMERAFVLAPLCEVAPQWRHPLTFEPACQALARVGGDGVARTEFTW